MTPLDLLEGALRGAVPLAVALAAMPLLRRAPASARRLVLALALAGAALVPVLSRAMPSWRILPAPAPAIAAAGAPFAEPVGEAVAAPAAHPAASEPAPAAAPPAPARRSPWGSVLFAMWALGALAVLGRLAVGLARARALAARAEPVAHPAIEAAMREAGVSAEVRAGDEVDAPVVTGLLRPVIVVPREALAWSDACWRSVLLHELAHVRQRDALAHLAGQIACALHWFDPLVWWAAHRLRTERELAADERALSTGTRPSEYAGHLLAIAARAARAHAVPAGALGMAGRSELRARVEAIVRPGGPRAPLPAARAAAIAAIAAGLTGAAACATPGAGGGAATPGPAASAAGEPGPGAGGALADEVAAKLGAPPGRTELTIRPDLQAIVDEEMKRLDAEHHPVAATAIVLEPASGEVLALSGAATAVEARVSGSTMKPLVIAAALEDRVITPADRFDCGNGSRAYGDLILRDASPHGELDVTGILARSSNVGASRIFDKLGGGPLTRWLGRYHFGAASGLELRAAPVGAVPAFVDGSFAGGALAAGHGPAIGTPAHMAAAYGALANQGVYNAPTLVRRPAAERAGSSERLFRPETARAVLDMLERAVDSEQATGKAARIDGVRVAGKTGTSEEEVEGQKTRYYASFIGIAPADAPRFVVLVGAVVAADNANGGRVAAPVFARITARALGR